MSYSDPQYRVNHFANMASARSFGTATASSATGHTLSDVVELPKFIKRTKLSAVRLKVTTIPNAASTALVAAILNGTDTAGTAVLTTAALGATVDFTMVSAYNTYTAGAEPTISLSGTATASAAAAGAYDVFFEFVEQP